jgi:hypothetical protein
MINLLGMRKYNFIHHASLCCGEVNFAIKNKYSINYLGLF